MAGLKKHFKAFTMIESIVALVIIMLCFGIAVAIFVQVKNSQQAVIRLKATLAIEEIMLLSEENQYFLDEQFEYDGFYINKSCYAYQPGSNAIVVVLECYLTNQQKMWEHKEIILQTSP